MALNRRGFLTFAAGAGAGVLFTPIPWKLTDDMAIWTQNWSWIPSLEHGKNEYVSVTSKMCPSACGLKVRTVGGRPVRTVGDDAHPLSLGATTSLAAAEVQLLYSESRLKRPLKKSADKAFLEISWEDAEKMLEEKLAAAKGPGKLAAVSGDETGSINDVLSGLVAKMGGADFFLAPSETQAANLAWTELLGGQGRPGYDLEGADYVFAIGADLLESWGVVVRNRRAYKAGRPHGETPKVKFAYAGPMKNNTAVGSDVWLPVKPGGQQALALGLLAALAKGGKSNADVSGMVDLVKAGEAFTPEKLDKDYGVPAAKFAEIVKDLLAAKAPLVVVGSEFGVNPGAQAIAAGFAVNALLGRINKPGGLVALPDVPKALEAAMDYKVVAKKCFVAFMEAVASGKTPAPQALVLYETNPVYSLAGQPAVAEAMKKIPVKIAFTTFLDETALACDLVLPMPMGIERMDDVAAPYGAGKFLYAMNKAAVKPVFNVKPAGDVLVKVGKKIGADLGVGSFEDVLKAKAKAVGADLAELKKGKVFTSDVKVEQTGLKINAAVGKVAAPDAGLILAPYAKLNYGTAKTALTPFGVKTIFEDVLLKNDSYIAVNSATAQKLGAAEGDFVSVQSKAGQIKVKVHIQETVMSDVAAAPMNLGHTAFDQFSKGKGQNTSAVLVAKADAVGLVTYDLGVKIAKA